MCMLLQNDEFYTCCKMTGKEEDQKQLAKPTIKEQTHTLQQEQILKHQCLSQKKQSQQYL